jgi:hypothetical protein
VAALAQNGDSIRADRLVPPMTTIFMDDLPLLTRDPKSNASKASSDYQ